MSFLSCEEMLAAARSQNLSLAEAILRSDLAESRLTEEASRHAMHHLWHVMEATSREYDPAQRSRSGLSGGDAAKVEQAHQAGRSYGGDYLAEVTAEALKTAECNACMKRIVAAPTAGSCGVLPAVLLPLAHNWGFWYNTLDGLIYGTFILAAKGMWHLIDFGQSFYMAAALNEQIRKRKREEIQKEGTNNG